MNLFGRTLGLAPTAGEPVLTVARAEAELLTEIGHFDAGTGVVTACKERVRRWIVRSEELRQER